MEPEMNTDLRSSVFIPGFVHAFFLGRVRTSKGIGLPSPRRPHERSNGRRADTQAETEKWRDNVWALDRHRAWALGFQGSRRALACRWSSFDNRSCSSSGS